MPTDDGIFVHAYMSSTECMNNVKYDDEPCCYKHSPDEGSSLRGFSAKKWVEGQTTDEDREALAEFLNQPNSSLQR